MLSHDEIEFGIPFILKMQDSAGATCLWMERLKGEQAKHWYTIHAGSDWASLRAQAMQVFQHPIDGPTAEHIRRNERCVVIHPTGVVVEELQKDQQ